jgi:hypothetical protein
MKRGNIKKREKDVRICTKKCPNRIKICSHSIKSMLYYRYHTTVMHAQPASRHAQQKEQQEVISWLEKK